MLGIADLWRIWFDVRVFLFSEGFGMVFLWDSWGLMNCVSWLRIDANKGGNLILLLFITGCKHMFVCDIVMLEKLV